MALIPSVMTDICLSPSIPLWHLIMLYKKNSDAHNHAKFIVTGTTSNFRFPYFFKTF